MHWREQRGIDAYRPRQIVQSDCEISSLKWSFPRTHDLLDTRIICATGWDLVIFGWFVLKMCKRVILHSLFARSGSAPIEGGKKEEFRDFTIVTYENRPFPSCFVLQCQNESLYNTIHMKSSDYLGKKVNPPYRYSNKGNPSQVTFRHCTRLFRGYYSLVTWMFTWTVYVSSRFKAK